jgi:hypothetical protein
LIVKQATPVTSDLAIEEAARNVQLKRPLWRESLAKIVAATEQVASSRFPLPVDLNDKDVPLLCAAIASRCDTS